MLPFFSKSQLQRQESIYYRLCRLYFHPHLHGKNKFSVRTSFAESYFCFNIKYMKKKKIRRLHPTGQLSIFIVLIFQALFILFAMSLNVALVVHDKINLQNSVDIAAYYGAMKQAEMMNAIAHINYQIRQSWKLLVWRYRVLGSMGVTHNSASSPTFNDTEHIFRVFTPPHPFTTGPYFFLRRSQMVGTI